MADEQQVLVSQPTDVPRDLLDALARAFRARADVSAAYFAQIAYGADEPAHWLIAVETAEWDTVVPAIETVLNAVRPARMVDFFPLDRNEPAGFSAAILIYPPFYTRTP